MLEKYLDQISHVLRYVKRSEIDIYTFAIYHDHESGFVSICIDTIESSKKTVNKSNSYSKNYFMKAINDGDLSEAMLWSSNSGRSFSLGNFLCVNLASIDVPLKPKKKNFYRDMVLAIEEMSEEISIYSSHENDLFFCCSTETEEVGLVWSK